MGTGPDNQPFASPWNFFPNRKRRVTEFFAELLRSSFLPFSYVAAVDHYIMVVAPALDLYLAKSDQSCFHISTFRWLNLQGNHAAIRIHNEACNKIETHEHKGDFKE
jgi:hypothetical protein